MALGAGVGNERGFVGWGAIGEVAGRPDRLTSDRAKLAGAGLSTAAGPGRSAPGVFRRRSIGATARAEGGGARGLWATGSSAGAGKGLALGGGAVGLDDGVGVGARLIGGFARGVESFGAPEGGGASGLAGASDSAWPQSKHSAAVASFKESHREQTIPSSARSANGMVIEL